MEEQLEGMDLEPPEIHIVEMEVKRSVPPARAAARADESDRAGRQVERPEKLQEVPS